MNDGWSFSLLVDGQVLCSSIDGGALHVGSCARQKRPGNSPHLQRKRTMKMNTVGGYTRSSDEIHPS